MADNKYSRINFKSLRLHLVCSMHRHRRHASLDSYSAAAASANLGQSSIRHAYTLQQTPGLRTARLTAHTSPLSLAAALTPPLTPRGPVEFEDKIGLPALAMKSANPLDEEGSDSSESDAELDAEMERMVSSVVNSPTEPDPPMTKSEQRASLGYGPPPGLPPPPPVSGYFAGQMPHLDLNERKERMSSFASAGRSLLGASESSAKTNIGMQAAFGNFKKRCLSSESAVENGKSKVLTRERQFRTCPEHHRSSFHPSRTRRIRQRLCWYPLSPPTTSCLPLMWPAKTACALLDTVVRSQSERCPHSTRFATGHSANTVPIPLKRFTKSRKRIKHKHSTFRSQWSLRQSRMRQSRLLHKPVTDWIVFCESAPRAPLARRS